ncbi:hypothetical protein ACLKA7_004595 [Drosophila subpalustris]
MAACCFAFSPVYETATCQFWYLNWLKTRHRSGELGLWDGGMVGQWTRNGELVVGAVAFNELVNAVVAALYNAITQSLVTLHLTKF